MYLHAMDLLGEIVTCDLDMTVSVKSRYSSTAPSVTRGGSYLHDKMQKCRSAHSATKEFCRCRGLPVKHWICQHNKSKKETETKSQQYLIVIDIIPIINSNICCVSREKIDIPFSITIII